ncbi:MAG: PEP-CTERM sorting domain-containing protein [Rubrivivax sp.]|nr:MAG: PEP-CTERM sorting domain-containing protein [Rubrivivax sp.]
MQVRFKGLMAAAALAWASVVGAAPVTVPLQWSNGPAPTQPEPLTGRSLLVFSEDFLGVMNTMPLKVYTSYASLNFDQKVVWTQDGDGNYTHVAYRTPMASITHDSATSTVLSADWINGGISFQMITPTPGVANGGAFFLHNISIDLENQVIRGIGLGMTANDYIDFGWVDLWSIGSISGDPTWGPAAEAGEFQMVFSDLSLTTQGRQAIIDSLRLLKPGVDTLDSVQDFGTITMSLAVPEPSAYLLVLAGIGMVGIRLKRRRLSQD